MVKRKKDPVYDPAARVYLTGISGERISASNPGSKYREVSVSIYEPDNPQSGRSFVDSQMENYDKVGWPTITHILAEGETLTGIGVLRKNYERDEIYFDCDHIDHLEIVREDHNI
jgi:hypothetical protein